MTVSVSSSHTMAITTDGTLLGWGNNRQGQLGDGTTIDRHSPVHIMDNTAAVSAGRHVMAITTDGILWGWGHNGQGQLGNGTAANVDVSPARIMDNLMLSTVTQAQPIQMEYQPPANNTISVTVNGTDVNFTDQQPALIDGRTLVPVRGVFEALGFDVGWDGEIQQVTLSRANDTIIITIDSATFTANGANHTLDVPAQIIGGSTMLPIRAVLEAVGYELDWDGATQTVIISTN